MSVSGVPCFSKGCYPMTVYSMGQMDKQDFECGFGFPKCAGKDCPNFLSSDGLSCLHLVNIVPEKRLVFADRQHATDYDQQLKEYLESLGEQVEPSTIESNFSERERVGSDVFELVGRGSVTNENCGRFLRYDICNKLEKHNVVLNYRLHGVTFDSGNFKGKVFVHKVFNHCDKPSCPICYSHGWAYREAGKIYQRIMKASQGFVDKFGVKFSALGVAEHFSVSPPASDYGLSYEKLKAKVLRVVFSRGVIGGVMIFHPKRYRKYDVVQGGIRHMRGWYFSPHFHIIGFLLNGYSRCRNCTKVEHYKVKTASGRVVTRIGNDVQCRGCDGYEAVARKLAWGDMDIVTGKPSGFYNDAKGKCHKADNWVVRVQDKRETIFGTASYQLNHAGYRIGVRYFHPATWFGSCNSNKLKVTIEFRKRCCPICHSELVRGKYLGSDLFNRFDAYGESDMVVDLIEFGSGSPVIAWEESHDNKWKG